jgi:hypothetical protein
VLAHCASRSAPRVPEAGIDPSSIPESFALVAVQGEERRVGAIDQVKGSVNAADPGHELIVGDDIFRSPL